MIGGSEPQATLTHKELRIIVEGVRALKAALGLDGLKKVEGRAMSYLEAVIDSINRELSGNH